IYGGTPPYSIYISGNQTNWEQEINLIDSIPAGVYRIDVVDANNCHHQGDALTIAINDSEIDCLQIPGAFSPNGDGYNDTWQISNIDMFPRILIQVYNRWGQLLYEASISDDFWDGTFNHSPVPAGTYLYRINLHNDTEPRLGTVTIIR
ncbi:MAG TPA: gliding motility-associated C-terminal domain-containing protein, partial [Bacteroidales bacterium]|nr:gliding motility-associated C-terminal domain-containing protein [Bacteroidales bacterium]